MNTVPVPSAYPSSGDTSPAGQAIEVSPADVDLPYISRALYVGTTGNLTVVMAGAGNTVTFIAVQAGAVLPIRVTQVTAATTAGAIVAMY